MWTIEEEKVRLRRVALAQEKGNLVGVLRELERRRDEAVGLITEVDGRIAELEGALEAVRWGGSTYSREEDWEWSMDL
jgi:hypothetical protein